MPHRNDGFWVSVFRKSPLIATFMAIGGIAAGSYAVYQFAQLARFLRAYLCANTSCTLAGIFVGLIIGVALDSLFGALRNDQKKKRRDRW